MNTGIRIARIWGIPIRLHLSWFLILALVTWSLAIGVFPSQYPTLSTGSLWLLGGITSIFFAASVLLHELGHAWVSLRDGIPVRSITLFFFGGMAQIAREPGTPGAEFRIAMIGPLTSLALAALFGLVYMLDRSFPGLAAPTAWLARINLALGLFNLIPGFPLDGGRVLRAAVWQLTGDPLRATRITAIVGRLMALGLILFGIWTVANRQLVNGIWLLLIGWFLQNSASGAYNQARLYHFLRSKSVSQIMGPRPSLVSPEMTLDRLIDEQVVRGGGLVFQIEGGGPNSILTLSEIKAIPEKTWRTVTVGQALALRRRFISVRPEMNLVEAMMHMDDHRAAQVPVMMGEEVLGVLTREQVWSYVRENGE